MSSASAGCSAIHAPDASRIHPDHYGLAGRIREASGAWIALHPADAELIHDRYDEPDDLLARVAAALRRMGAPDEELTPLQNAAMPVRPLVDPVRPDVLLEDGARPEVPGWSLEAIWTPGHSPGHLCFYESALDLMLSGDHVLPRITPNISFHPQPLMGEYRLEDREQIEVAHRSWKDAGGSPATVDVVEFRDKNLEGSHDGGFATYDQCVIEGIAPGVRLILEQRRNRTSFEYFTIEGHADPAALERVIREVQLEEPQA